MSLFESLSVRWVALRWLARKSPEVGLNIQIQRSVQSATYPTLFGWHTRRDDELSMMLLLSATGLRLAPNCSRASSAISQR